ncbi:MAG: alpha/beta hydrolase [Tepidisphaera sp.]
MSILRLSADRDEMYAPDSDGTFIAGPYDPKRHVGALGESPSKGGVYTMKPPAGLAKHLQAVLPGKISALPASKPVVIMVHGFLFNPFEALLTKRSECDNPHFRVFHFDDVDPIEDNECHFTPWPKRLGFLGQDQGADGLAVGFGWLSNPGFAKSMLDGFKNFYSRAYDYATEVAWLLVHTIDQLHTALAAEGKGRKIDLFCHSLGSRVVIHAIKLAARRNMEHVLKQLDRVIILGGAEYVRDAQEMFHEVLRLCPKPADGPRFYNVGCRENDVLDLLGENFGPRGFGMHDVVGHDGLGFSETGNRWIDLQIDSPKLADWAKKKFKWTLMGDGPRVWDHWYYYTHEPNCRLYKAVLRQRAAWDIKALIDAGIPTGIQ